MKSLDRPRASRKDVATKRRPKKARRAAPKRRAKLSEAAIAEMFRRFAAANPEPKSELEYKNPFTLLVAVVLSAQATDAGVNKATRALFKIADTPEKMVRLGEDKLREHIKTIGLYRNKARNVILLSRQLIAITAATSRASARRSRRCRAWGARRRTSSSMSPLASRRMAVDTHVFRVANRTGLSAGKTPLEVEEDLLRVIPPKYGLHAHHWLILHGRYVCKARRPECPSCLIRDLCLYDAKTPGIGV